MSETLVRRAFDVWNANDWEALEQLWNSDGVAIAPEGWPEPGEFVGWPAIREQFERLKDSWVEERVEVLSARPAGEHLLVDLRWTVLGEASGAPLDVEMWMLCDFRGERFARAEYFLDREAALTAAGEGASA